MSTREGHLRGLPLSAAVAAVRGRPIAFAAALAGTFVVLAGAAYVYDHSRRDQIAKGVTIDGIDVGGLGAVAAREKLRRMLIGELQKPIIVRAHTRTWHLDAKAVDLTVDINSMVGQALSASRGGSILTRTIRGIFGGSLDRDIPLAASYSHAAVRRLTASIRASVNRPARDAAVVPSATGLRETKALVGLAVQNRRLGSAVEHAVTGLGGQRTVIVPTQVLKPSVTTSQLASKYPAYIIVDRGAFRLRFYRHLKLVDTYEIAVGMQGLETPPGMYSIGWKQVNPPWYVPNKPWAGKLAGTVVPPGPADPLKARFMSFSGGAGIHGIDPSEYSSIGHTASHGCVRMRIPDVIALYSRTPVGTPVFIA